MAQLGEALAWEYIRNVGVDACKPDTHLRRFLGSGRMGTSQNEIATVEETIQQVEELSKVTGISLASIDNIIWSFCADGYGEVCTATPHCEKCVIRNNCQNSKVLLPFEIVTYDEIRLICKACDFDPVKIGQHFLDLTNQK